MTDPPSLPTTLQDWLPWLILLLLAVAGGVINTYGRWKKNRVISLFELVGELTISGFVAVLIALACQALQISQLWTLVLAGVSAHLGPRALFLIEWIGLRRLMEWMGWRQEDVENLVDRPTGFPRAGKRPSEPTPTPKSGSGPGASG